MAKLPNPLTPDWMETVERLKDSHNPAGNVTYANYNYEAQVAVVWVAKFLRSPNPTDLRLECVVGEVGDDFIAIWRDADNAMTIEVVQVKSTDNLTPGKLGLVLDHLFHAWSNIKLKLNDNGHAVASFVSPGRYDKQRNSLLEWQGKVDAHRRSAVSDLAAALKLQSIADDDLCLFLESLQIYPAFPGRDLIIANNAGVLLETASESDQLDSRDLDIAALNKDLTQRLQDAFSRVGNSLSRTPSGRIATALEIWRREATSRTITVQEVMQAVDAARHRGRLSSESTEKVKAKPVSRTKTAGSPTPTPTSTANSPERAFFDQQTKTLSMLVPKLSSRGREMLALIIENGMIDGNQFRLHFTKFADVFGHGSTDPVDELNAAAADSGLMAFDEQDGYATTVAVDDIEWRLLADLAQGRLPRMVRQNKYRMT